MIPRRAEGTVAGDSRAAASLWVPHTWSTQEQQTVCPTETLGAASRTAQTPAQKNLPGRETLEQLQAQRNTMQRPRICLNWDGPSPTPG